MRQVLAKYRFSAADSSYGGFDGAGTKFGVYITPLNSGIVRPGDQVRVLQSAGHSEG